MGLAIKAAVGLLIAAIWTSTPGAEEARCASCLCHRIADILLRDGLHLPVPMLNVLI